MVIFSSMLELCFVRLNWGGFGPVLVNSIIILMVLTFYFYCLVFSVKMIWNIGLLLIGSASCSDRGCVFVLI